MHSSGLLNNPEQYAERAIEELKRQLQTAKSPSKITKLNSKIFQWTKMLEIMRDRKHE